MPRQKLEKNLEKLVLKNFTVNKMDADIPQNNSSAELVQNSDEVAVGGLKDVKFKEWVMVLILCFVNLINYMDRFTLAGVLDDIIKYYGVQNDKGGLLQTAFVLSYMVFGPLFGYLGDRYKRKYIMAFGVLLWSLTTLVGSFMKDYWWFLLFRALVGIGEASYSTIAPTIISDLFVGNVRSKMLAYFYFAIPVGSGLGYIIGAETSKLAGNWQWGLRVTPALGLLAVILIIFFLMEPERGQSEGSHIETTPWSEDLKYLVKNRSFMVSSAGFTCVTFVAGALSWWGPKFISEGLELSSNSKFDSESVSKIFGVVSMFSGIIGVPTGSYIAQALRQQYPSIDPHLCAFGLFLSTPMVFGACIAASHSPALCFTFVFFGELFLNLTWSLVADILLYVVLPTRRSTAAGFQLLFSHALGDAGSPYLIGVMSEAIRVVLPGNSDSPLNTFKALQYALFTTCAVEVLGAFFFLINTLYIVQDKQKVDKSVQGNSQQLLTDSIEGEIPS